MQHAIASFLLYLGDIGLYSSVVGFAVMLLMPDRTGHAFGGALAMGGGVVMGYELVLAHAI